MSHDVYDAIADPSRRKILQLLAARDLSVQEITAHFSVSRPAISKHLRILREAGLVHEEKMGRQRLYHLHPEKLRELREWVAYFDQFWAAKLRTLQALVEETSDDTNSTD
jgi:DNA-binding transcriptional ArsR family regulator